MNTSTVRALQTQVEGLLTTSDISQKYGISIGQVTYDQNSASFKIEIIEKAADGTTLSTDARLLNEVGPSMFGLPKNSYKKRFFFRTTEYEAIGLRPQAVKYPVKGRRLKDGKVFFFQANVLGGNYSVPTLRFQPAPSFPDNEGTFEDRLARDPMAGQGE